MMKKQMSWGGGFVYSADEDVDADFVYSVDSVVTTDDWYTNGQFLLFDCF